MIGLWEDETQREDTDPSSPSVSSPTTIVSKFLVEIVINSDRRGGHDKPLSPYGIYTHSIIL